MTWDEMIADLRHAGMPESLLPGRGHAEGRLGLTEERGRFLVTFMERGETQHLAEFPNEESAVNFIHDSRVFALRLKGDTRFDKWNANPKAFPLLPRAEDFGGRTIP